MKQSSAAEAVRPTSFQCHVQQRRAVTINVSIHRAEHQMQACHLKPNQSDNKVTNDTFIISMNIGTHMNLSAFFLNPCYTDIYTHTCLLRNVLKAAFIVIMKE